MLFAADFGVGQVVWSMFWFFLFFIWIMLVFRVFQDLFRSKDLSGVAKVIWTLFVIVFPYLGVFVYLIARGDKMAANEVDSMQRQEEQLRTYIRDAAGTSGGLAQELERLAKLRDDGVISADEFAALKAKALA